LSWAKLGAEVTGVDLSNKAIELAKELCSETGLSANFLCSNIYELPKLLDKKFDILFTSYGAITWLPDLQKWAEIVAYFLKPGGIFYIIEFHPVLFMLDEEGKGLKYSYFHQSEPLEIDNENSYADQTTTFKHRSYEWNHSLSDVINALLKVGLGLEYVHEFPYSAYNCWPFLEELEDGKWVVKGYSTKLPMMFSIKAIKRE
jgi:ubiquinone/menaquinone biosynthesis C-methylase UbiE